MSIEVEVGLYAENGGEDVTVTVDVDGSPMWDSSGPTMEIALIGLVRDLAHELAGLLAEQETNP